MRLLTQLHSATLALLLIAIPGCADSAMTETHAEIVLLGKIQKTEPGATRDSFIRELENVPQFRRSFYERWIFIHTSFDAFKGWSDNGYDPSQSQLPRDVQLLAATDYGKSDIDNGGFHQFFYNHTGTFAPEMIEWFTRAGFPEVVSAIKEAMAIFGNEFPRSQSERQRILATLTGADGSESNPFSLIDAHFYSALDDRALYDEAANRWLRETCGISSLTDTY
jgi:hypothetical protein